MRYHLAACPCGSGLQRTPKHDGHGIFLFFCCPKCEGEKLSKWRDDILLKYSSSEPIEPEP